MSISDPTSSSSQTQTARMRTLAAVKWFYTEFGLSSVRQASSDASLIILARSSRMLAYGAASVFMALFFSEIGISDFRIGLFMTLTFAGDVVLTLAITLLADSLGRRRTILLGSCMMVLSGAVFAFSENYWVLLIAAVFGVISPSGSDFGPFRAIEESMLSQITTPETRSDVLSWYVTTSTLGSAIGTELSGRIVQALAGSANAAQGAEAVGGRGWTTVAAYHAVFGLYIGMGLVNVFCVALLSSRTEAPQNQVGKEGEGNAEEMQMMLESTDMEVDDDGRTPNVLPSASPLSSTLPSSSTPPPTPTSAFSRFAQISSTTRSTMYTLWVLLAVDSLADGMVGYSLTTYYIKQKFDASASTLGDINSVSYFLAAGATIFAGPLSNRLGLVRTMVYTHVPSSAAVLLFPLPPNLVGAIMLFFVRAGLNNMDQAPRAALIAGVVPPAERTAVNGITSTVRTLASTVGPLVTGSLATHNQFWIAFVAAGALRLTYDIGLWYSCINIELYRYEESEGK